MSWNLNGDVINIPTIQSEILVSLVMLKITNMATVGKL